MNESECTQHGAESEVKLTKAQQYARDYYLKNKEKVSRQAAERYKRDKVKIDARNKVWHEANRESANRRVSENQKRNRSAVNERERKWRKENRIRSNAQDVAWRKANPEKVRETRRKYLLSEKGKRKTAREKPKRKAYGAKWYQNNREKRLATIRAYAKTPKGKAVQALKFHKRRLWIAASPNPPTANDILEIMQAAKGRCYYCKQRRKLTLDHVVPRAKGGQHVKSNLIMACGICNSSKGAKDPLEFAREIGLLLV